MPSPIRRLIVAALLAQSSCAPITAIESSVKDVAGPYPLEYEKMVKSVLFDYLRDPYSIRDFRISKPVLGPLWVGVQRGGNVQAWVLCVGFNAKNAYGAYVGYQTYKMAIKDWQFVLNPLGHIYFKEGECDV